MTSGTSPLRERRVLHLAPLPLFDIRVTVAAETPSCGNQESLEVATMRVVATGALTRSHRSMDSGLDQFCLQLGMAGLAQGTWTVSEKRGESSHVRIVASRAFACLDWSVLYPCSQSFEIMAAQACLDFVDGPIGRQLRPAWSDREENRGRQDGNGSASNDADGWIQGVPPGGAGISSWQDEQSRLAKGS